MVYIIGTGSAWKACPAGTYSDIDGLYTESQCKPCAGGRYCQGEHLTTTTGDCNAGQSTNISTLYISTVSLLLYLLYIYISTVSLLLYLLYI